MTEEVLKDGIVGLKEAYGELTTGKGANGATLIKIQKAPLPKGCAPLTTTALVVIQAGQPKPIVYVKPGVKLPNGASPRSTSVVAIEGEEWLQFSYNIVWDGNSHSLLQLVAAALGRFAKCE